MLARAGCVASDEEAAELIEAANGDGDLLARFVKRRMSGEPSAWIIGRVRFCGHTVKVGPGVYVPRWQTEPLAERAAALLPEGGVAVDVCTGSGAIAVVLRERRPSAHVVATDGDLSAVECSRANGIETYLGDLLACVPRELQGEVDLLVGVVPYVPSEALHLLARDVLAFEPSGALDGGPRGTAQLIRTVSQSVGWLRPGGALLLELGGDQGEELKCRCEELGFVDVSVVRDDDGDVRSIEAHRP
ncbi:MAG: HemK family protein methyltransferase [Acidimicrobiales bacterium]